MREHMHVGSARKKGHNVRNCPIIRVSDCDSRLDPIEDLARAPSCLLIHDLSGVVFENSGYMKSSEAGESTNLFMSQTRTYGKHCVINERNSTGRTADRKI